MEDVDDVTFDADEIQICKPFSTVNNRIENFLKRKRDDCNDRNTRLYCKNVYLNSSRTCDTIAPKRQKGSECFIKKTSANNISGPLCNGGFDPASENSYKLKISNNFYGDKSDIYERLSNVETCLNMEVDDHNINIYEKIKSIEDRLLQLENERSNDKKVLSSNIQHTEMINYNDNHCIQNEQIKHNLRNENVNSLASEIIPKKSKYTADDIQEFINTIKKKEKKNVFNI